ncbi:nuclear transport factor 2 family protein [Pseudochryseolinea flava]|uniref:Nuclear transport factor 2 family protein n=1 Tax=Pseudochryseolinea flava TaxID=2059302 RepID=A0A364Y4N1_9BACT|nr:nuclear transport factor 2 family protein [Pseudochryseolinea flava]RAW01736.1 nuclear transport factor 2 family protein [Pseudochryseolinea flava]
MTHDQLIKDFYSACNQRDYAFMQQAYHPKATFFDPVFQELNAQKVKAMWQMLLTASKDLRVECSNVHSNNASGSCRWDAWYTFSKTGRKVHNIIHAKFQFEHGLIIRHEDQFDLWRWSRQALGTSGLLLGWSDIVQGKVRATAKGSLDKFIAAGQ